MSIVISSNSKKIWTLDSYGRVTIWHIDQDLAHKKKSKKHYRLPNGTTKLLLFRKNLFFASKEGILKINPNSLDIIDNLDGLGEFFDLWWDEIHKKELLLCCGASSYISSRFFYGGSDFRYGLKTEEPFDLLQKIPIYSCLLAPKNETCVGYMLTSGQGGGQLYQMEMEEVIKSRGITFIEINSIEIPEYPSIGGDLSQSHFKMTLSPNRKSFSFTQFEHYSDHFEGWRFNAWVYDLIEDKISWGKSISSEHTGDELSLFQRDEPWPASPPIYTPDGRGIIVGTTDGTLIVFSSTSGLFEILHTTYENTFCTMALRESDCSLWVFDQNNVYQVHENIMTVVNRLSPPNIPPK